MSTEIIVRHCAPTLAGLKVGNLFSYRYTDAREVLKALVEQNKCLNKKGVFLIAVKIQNGTVLVYAYRENKLKEVLSDKDVQKFLKVYGYKDFSVSACLKKLRDSLLEEQFPHEIGVFLGYPLEDIKEFIRNKGENCSCIGCWKAYVNISEAEKTFAKFKKCTKIYCQKLLEGIDINRLTVNG